MKYDEDGWPISRTLVQRPMNAEHDGRRHEISIASERSLAKPWPVGGFQ